MESLNLTINSIFIQTTKPSLAKDILEMPTALMDPDASTYIKN
jgi:hypothetical protein